MTMQEVGNTTTVSPPFGERTAKVPVLPGASSGEISRDPIGTVRSEPRVLAIGPASGVQARRRMSANCGRPGVDAPHACPCSSAR
jgi:hypothetical protein